MNYPNPFQSQTNIEFSLKSDSPVSIYIIDEVGKKVAEVIKNEIYSHGNHSLVYNTASLVAGTYFCILVTKNVKKTIKIVRVK